MYDPNQVIMWQVQEPTEMLMTEFRVLTPIESTRVDEGPAAEFDVEPKGLSYRERSRMVVKYTLIFPESNKDKIVARLPMVTPIQGIG
jgi:hypothetical protein